MSRYNKKTIKVQNYTFLFVQSGEVLEIQATDKRTGGERFLVSVWGIRSLINQRLNELKFEKIVINPGDGFIELATTEEAEGLFKDLTQNFNAQWWMWCCDVDQAEEPWEA